MLRQNYVTIDREAILHNYRVLSSAMPRGVSVMPVVKADAYGHGMEKVAQALAKEGAMFFAVAIAEEGIALRNCGVSCNVLVMGAATERAAVEAIQHGLTQTVFEPHMVNVLNRLGKAARKSAKVHIKLDTGMGRIGLQTETEARQLAEALASAEWVQATGIYTHFADADNPAADGGINDFSHQQLEQFLKLKSIFSSSLTAHAANSALSLLAPEASFQMVREGIALYGYPPVKTSLPLRRALRWETEIVHIKEVAKGTSLGYGRTFVAPGNMRIATVAVGYGDGYHRTCSNRAEMLVRGKRAKVVGRVCMDQTMIDVTEIEGASVGDAAVLIGAQGADEIGADELAVWAETISYEVLLAVTRRVPRKYV